MRLHSIPVLGLLALSLGVNAGCDRRTLPFVPADREPPGPERPVRIPGLETAKPRPRALTPGSSLNQRAFPGARVSGAVRLPEGLVVRSGAVLFVVARGPDGGPPLAATRLSAGSFPVSFTLGPTDLMAADRPFAGPMRISARVDSDGDPLTQSRDDLVGEVSGPVEAGQQGLEIVLRPARDEAGK